MSKSITIQELQTRYLPAIQPEDFFLLVAHATGKEKVFLLTHPEYVLPEEARGKATAFLARRLKHEPVAYITGHKEFYGRDFIVTPATLIPRPETETLIEAVLAYVDEVPQTIFGSTEVLDIGTGSGNIIVTLARELKSIPFQFSGIDISKAALVVARRNATLHRVEKNITFIESDLLKKYKASGVKVRRLIIAANLPYLSETIYRTTIPDVKEYEPKGALISNQAGRAHYERLLQGLATLPLDVSEMALFFEISPEQAPALSASVHATFPQAAMTIIRDLSGRERVVQAFVSYREHFLDTKNPV